MDAPNYTCNHSLVQNHIWLCGNIIVADELKSIVKETYIGHMDLYDAQKEMREHCISKYGTDFYEKSADAIMFIIENEYCNAEREKLPLFDRESYEYDMRTGRVY